MRRGRRRQAARRRGQRGPRRVGRTRVGLAARSRPGVDHRPVRAVHTRVEQAGRTRAGQVRLVGRAGPAARSRSVRSPAPRSPAARSPGRRRPAGTRAGPPVRAARCRGRGGAARQVLRPLRLAVLVRGWRRRVDGARVGGRAVRLLSVLRLAVSARRGRRLAVTLVGAAVRSPAAPADRSRAVRRAAARMAAARTGAGGTRARLRTALPAGRRGPAGHREADRTRAARRSPDREPRDSRRTAPPSRGELRTDRTNRGLTIGRGAQRRPWRRRLCALGGVAGRGVRPGLLRDLIGGRL